MKDKVPRSRITKKPFERPVQTKASIARANSVKKVLQPATTSTSMRPTTQSKITTSPDSEKGPNTKPETTSVSSTTPASTKKFGIKPVTTTTTSSSSRVVNNRPKIVPTKASLARAKSNTVPITTSTINRKRKAVEEPEIPPVTYEEALESLKGRASWDLRGRMRDLNQIIELNSSRLDKIRELKKRLEDLKNTKEAQQKESIQKIEDMKARLEEIEKDHLTAVEQMKYQQNDKHQKLSLTNEQLSEKLSRIEVIVSETKKKVEEVMNELNQTKQHNQANKDSIKTTLQTISNIRVDSKSKKKDIQDLGGFISTNKFKIHEKQNQSSALNSRIEKTRISLAQTKELSEKMALKIQEWKEKICSLQ